MTTQTEEHRQRGIDDGHAAAYKCFNAMLKAEMVPAVASSLRVEEIQNTAATAAAMRGRVDTVDPVEAYVTARNQAFDQRIAVCLAPLGKFIECITKGRW